MMPIFYKVAPSVTRRFMRLLADYHGQQCNTSQIGRVFGLSYHTVNRYLDYLEGVHLVRRLLPLAAPLRQRLVKRPKVCWRDSGLLYSLLGIHDDQALLAHPMGGSSGEIMPPFMRAKGLSGSPAWESLVASFQPIPYQMTRRGNAIGFSALLLPKLCEAWVGSEKAWCLDCPTDEICSGS